MDLEQWLTAHGLENYIDVFRQNDIGVDVFTQLTEEDLKEMGVPIGARRRFLTAVNSEGHSPAPQPSPEQPSVQLAPQPVALQPPVQQPAAPADPQQQVELPPANQPPVAPASQPPAPPVTAQPQIVGSGGFLPGVQPPDVNISPPASSPQPAATPQVQASQTQATRHQPKAKNSRKATAIAVAIGVHVGIILLATTLTIFAASKNEPELVASIAPPATSPQQEMKKKTVQKQVKRAPSSASAAAAPMAIMMKANAEARFTTPDVTRTSTGPLGMGEGDVGAGAFGVGSGLGGAGDGGSFFGTATSGNLAVIFDVTGSMGEASDRVVSEINRTFKTAHVVCVFGAKFKDKPAKMVTYKSNKNIQETLLKQRNQSMNRNMLSLQNCDSLAMKKPFDGKVFQGLSSPTDKKKYLETNLESLGTAMEMLVQQKRPPGTIFVFSDFKDGADPKYMEKVAKLVKKKKVKVVIWYPFSGDDEFRDRRHYETFVKTVGGELKIEKL